MSDLVLTAADLDRAIAEIRRVRSAPLVCRYCHHVYDRPSRLAHEDWCPLMNGGRYKLPREQEK